MSSSYNWVRFPSIPNPPLLPWIVSFLFSPIHLYSDQLSFSPTPLTTLCCLQWNVFPSPFIAQTEAAPVSYFDLECCTLGTWPLGEDKTVPAVKFVFRDADGNTWLSGWLTDWPLLWSHVCVVLCVGYYIAQTWRHDEWQMAPPYPYLLKDPRYTSLLYPSTSASLILPHFSTSSSSSSSSSSRCTEGAVCLLEENVKVDATAPGMLLLCEQHESPELPVRSVMSCSILSSLSCPVCILNTSSCPVYSLPLCYSVQSIDAITGQMQSY